MNRTAATIPKESAETWEVVTEPWRQPGARVLVVDDDDDMRVLLSRRLVEEGYDVHDATSGTELLRVIESIQVDRWPLDGVDLIVLDNRMPEMTGLEAVRRLRSARWEMPVVLVTAFPDEDVREEAAALRVSVLAKPFSMDLLSNVVRTSMLSKAGSPDPETSNEPA